MRFIVIDNFIMMIISNKWDSPIGMMDILFFDVLCNIFIKIFPMKLNWLWQNRQTHESDRLFKRHKQNHIRWHEKWKTVTDANGKTIRYGYDELGNILTIAYPGGETIRYTYYAGGQIATVTDSKGRVTYYKYDKTGNLTDKERPNGTKEHCEYNNIGSTTKLTDNNGNVIQSYEYGAYGEVLSGDTKITQFLYNGQLGVMTNEKIVLEVIDRIFQNWYST